MPTQAVQQPRDNKDRWPTTVGLSRSDAFRGRAFAGDEVTRVKAGVKGLSRSEQGRSRKRNG